jgi:ADP-ribose pyrophosphatase YjhB (NUDIX family)
MALVLKDFKCKATKKVYRAGDEYTGERLEELQNIGYVEGSDEDQWPKHIGGCYYALSNGEKVKGKDTALEAQSLIDAE